MVFIFVCNSGKMLLFILLFMVEDDKSTGVYFLGQTGKHNGRLEENDDSRKQPFFSSRYPQFVIFFCFFMKSISFQVKVIVNRTTSSRSLEIVVENSDKSTCYLGNVMLRLPRIIQVS